MLQPTLSDAQAPKETRKFYFNCVFNTFQAHQWLSFPGLCDQHLWTAHNAFYFWCKKCSNGSKLLLLFLHRVHHCLALLPFIPHCSQRGWRECWVASCGAQLCHTNLWSFGNVSAQTAGSLPLQGWTIPLFGIVPELVNLGLAAGTWSCCCPWASPGLYKLLGFRSWKWFEVLQGWSRWGQLCLVDFGQCF